MLAVIALIYFTLSNLYLLGSFPINVFEFLDLRDGYAISDYATLFETGTYFNISAIVTGLLCGLDAITNKYYKKVHIKIYNLHALSAFTMAGVGLFPLTEVFLSTSRILHWIFAASFIFIYPLTRLLILREYNKKAFKKLSIVFILINLLALFVYAFVDFRYIAYPEYVVWVSLLTVIILSEVIITRKSKK